ncbi:MAG: hypothetical protein HOC20_01470 [Chloroflexi bacterium]|jgi:hypothetical protein|nr:hypothetical protein [Chloroflexota bacterium]
MNQGIERARELYKMAEPELFNLYVELMGQTQPAILVECKPPGRGYMVDRVVEMETELAREYHYPCIGNHGDDDAPTLPYVVSFDKPLRMNPGTIQHGGRIFHIPMWPDTCDIPHPEGFKSYGEAMVYAMKSFK